MNKWNHFDLYSFIRLLPWNLTFSWETHLLPCDKESLLVKRLQWPCCPLSVPLPLHVRICLWSIQLQIITSKPQNMHIMPLTLVWKAQQNGWLILVSHYLESQVGSGSGRWLWVQSGWRERRGHRWQMAHSGEVAQGTEKLLQFMLEVISFLN